MDSRQNSIEEENIPLTLNKDYYLYKDIKSAKHFWREMPFNLSMKLKDV